MMTIKCKRICKTYGKGENKCDALKEVNLELFAGKLTLLVGPSGSGKTTLLSIINTILTPDQGDLFILGRHINKMDEFEKAQFRSQNLGVIYQALYLIPTLTVMENTILPLAIKGQNEDISKNKAGDILKKLGLEQKFDSPPTQLSRGQQQRVAIARALINEPKIILCDEPTSALDQKAGLEFMTILHENALHNNQTVLVVTHDHRIFPLADRIININDGIIKE